MSSEQPAPAPQPLTRMRIAVTAVAVLVMAAVGYVAEIIAAFGIYPSCVATPPPGPPGFLLASVIITVICGGVPALVVGVRRGRATLVAFACGAIVPFGVLVYLATRTNNGFCI